MEPTVGSGSDGPAETEPAGQPAGRRLDSWKGIAAYLGRSERTVRRWEKDEGLPVHRLQHEKRGSIYAYDRELDAWLESRKRLIEPQPSIEPATDEGDQRLASRLPGIGRRAGILVGVACALVVLTSALAALIRDPIPRVLRITQLTHTGRVDTGPNFVTDGARVYFTERQGGEWALYQVSVHGGDPVRIQTPFASTTLYDISPDHTSLLIGEIEGGNSSRVWVLPIVGGPPRRLGDLTADDAVWTPNGQFVVYTRGTSLYKANADGSKSRQLAELDGAVRRPRVDPQGRSVRFTAIDPRGASTSLWQVGFDGSGLQRLSPIGQPSGGSLEGESDSAWTRSGKYFLFRSHARAPGGGLHSALWAVRETRMSGGRAGRSPIQLYVTPMSIFGPAIGPDASRVYFIGKQERYELVQYRAGEASFTPYLSGMSAASVSFSRDGNWITYVSLPDRALWRMRSDGGERLQLTDSRVTAFHPKWSPDGRHIAFMGTPRGTREQVIYVVPRDGGQPERVAGDPCDNPSWSPDGRSLIFMRPGPEGALWRIDLSNGESTVIPGSEHLTYPVWSPNGKYVAASEDGRRLKLFEWASGRWTKLAQSTSVSSIRWSLDSGSIYFQDLFGGIAQPVYRVSVPDGKMERVTPTRPVIPENVVAFGFSGITPTGGLLATLIRNNSDLYAIELDLGK